MGSRHFSRMIAIQTLYEMDFHQYPAEQAEKILQRNFAENDPQKFEPEFVSRIVNGVFKHRKEIDAIIEKGAPEWPIEKINIIDRNVLRVGIYELLWEDRNEVPPRVAIDEAIELAKEFSGESAGRFVNGVLGTIYDEISKR